MAYRSYNKLRASEFDDIVSKRVKIQYLIFNPLKFEVYDTHEKDENLTTNFKPTDDSDVINKAYLDEKLKKIGGHISHIEKGHNEFKLQYNKQSVEDIFLRRAVKTSTLW